MPRITQMGRVMVPVSDQDTAIAFYTDTLGFSLVADVPFGKAIAGSRSRHPAVAPRSHWCRRAASTSPGA